MKEPPPKKWLVSLKLIDLGGSTPGLGEPGCAATASRCRDSPLRGGRYGIPLDSTAPRSLAKAADIKSAPICYQLKGVDIGTAPSLKLS